MKTTWQGFLLGSLVLVSAANGQLVKGNPPMRDAATHEDLRVMRERDDADPMNQGVPVKAHDPDRVWLPEDLLARSEVLSFQGFSTLVPKGAILHVPAALQERLRKVKGSELQTWAEFFAANRGWILTHEVSRAQAGGRVPLDPQAVAGFQNSSYLIVATMKGGPISMLPPKEGTTVQPLPVASNR